MTEDNIGNNSEYEMRNKEQETHGMDMLEQKQTKILTPDPDFAFLS